MSARERLITRMAAAMPQSAAGPALDDLDAYRDEVLQEAAGKIRAEADELDAWPRGRYWKGWLTGARWAADAILKAD